MKLILSFVCLAFAVLLIISGIVGLFVPQDVFMGFVFYFPIIIAFSGLISLVYYFMLLKSYNSTLLLFDSILNLLLALLLVYAGAEFTANFIIYFISFVCAFRAVVCFFLSVKTKSLELKIWLWLLLLGLLNALVAVLFIVFPVAAGITLGVMISLLVIALGLVWLIAYFYTYLSIKAMKIPEAEVIDTPKDSKDSKENTESK